MESFDHDQNNQTTKTTTLMTPQLLNADEPILRICLISLIIYSITTTVAKLGLFISAT